jgi:carbon storage regulator CsrA
MAATLVFDRKEGEQVIIGEKILVTVLRIRKRYVSIAVAAPAEVPVVQPESHGERADDCDASSESYGPWAYPMWF